MGLDAQKRVCGSVCMCVSEHVFVCATNTTNIKQRERERSRRDSSFNGKLHIIFDSLTVQEYYNTHLHNVRFRLIYISPNLRACSCLGYKVQGVAFYANNLRLLATRFVLFLGLSCSSGCRFQFLACSFSGRSSSSCVFGVSSSSSWLGSCCV